MKKGKTKTTSKDQKPMRMPWQTMEPGKPGVGVKKGKGKKC